MTRPESGICRVFSGKPGLKAGYPQPGLPPRCMYEEEIYGKSTGKLLRIE